jgi:N-methylhydantoinase A
MTLIDNAARIGVDVGGTFTDVVLLRADGTTAIRKVLSTRPNYDAAVVEASALLADGAAVDGVAHGTTVATNAVL